jgi:hypothetical protein
VGPGLSLEERESPSRQQHAVEVRQFAIAVEHAAPSAGTHDEACDGSIDQLIERAAKTECRLNINLTQARWTRITRMGVDKRQACVAAILYRRHGG